MLTFSAPDGDIDFTTVDGLESVRQRARQRLLFLRAEWFLDITQGLPYLADVIGYQQNLNLARRAITDELLTVDDVDEVLNVQIEMNRKERILKYSADVKTRFGTALVTASQIA